MFLFKPYLHLAQTTEGDYQLYIAVALRSEFKLGTPKTKPATKESPTREITLPLIRQHNQVYYGPVELVINISQAEKDASGETGILVKIGDNSKGAFELQQKGKTKIVYLDQLVSTRAMNDERDWDASDKEP